MKKNNTIFTVIIILIIVILLLIKLLPNMLNKTNYDDLEVYKNNMVINIADSDKKQIISYLKKENFDRNNSLDEVNGTYMIKYGDIELTFNSDGSCYYKNNHTMENHNTTLSNELVNFVSKY